MRVRMFVFVLFDTVGAKTAYRLSLRRVTGTKMQLSITQHY